MKCPRCAQENPSHAKFCLECGRPLAELHERGPSTGSYADLQHARSEAVEQQIATADILRVIASSPTDLQTMLDAMAESAARLCSAYDSSIVRLEGDVLRFVAHHGPIPNPIGLAVPAIRGTILGRSVLERHTPPAGCGSPQAGDRGQEPTARSRQPAQE